MYEVAVEAAPFQPIFYVPNFVFRGRRGGSGVESAVGLLEL